MQFKVCGITDLAQAIALDEMKLNYIGFIFYAPSKRYVLNQLTLNQLADFNPKHAKKVVVFVNEPLEQVMDIINKAKLDIVQLHGDEDAQYCATINQIVPVVKVFRVGNCLPDFAAYDTTTTYYLFDTDSALYGGTGQHFNWELIKNTDFNKPYFLSGGIGPNDIHGIEVLQKTKAGKSLTVIDINSQFETAPGIKNLELIKTFINASI
jgi:phosphoribosylanthranilate isomerase